MRKLLIVVMLVGIGLPGNAWSKEERSLAVLPIDGRRIDEDTTIILSELLVGHLSTLNNRRLITMREVESMLDFETTKSMLHCQGGDCMRDVGNVLGVDEVLQSTVGRLGSQLIIGLSLLDMTRSEVIARASVKVDNDEDDYDQGLKEAVDLIFQNATTTGSGSNAADVSKALESTPGSSWSLPSTWSGTLLGGGVALLAAGGYFGSQAVAKRDEALEGKPRSQLAIPEGKAHMLKANILLGLGSVLVGGGLYLWMRENTAGDDEAISWSPVVYQDGVGVVVQGDLW